MERTWKWQLENSITDIYKLKTLFDLSDGEVNKLRSAKIRITPYMLNLLTKYKNTALIKQFIPTVTQTDISYCADFLNETEHQPIPGLIHRYNNKVIIVLHNECACYCQFCTRQRITNKSSHINSCCTVCDIKKIITYIYEHKEINDVLITGGDPLILDTQSLINVIEQIQKLENIKIVRIGTRVPITLPMRIDDELVAALKQYNNLYINIHINHPLELTNSSKTAILSLANSGIPLGSQSVLLKGINDNKDVLRKLFEDLISIKVKPYYLYQCDKVRGCEGFVVNPVDTIKIINDLYREMSGFAVPKFVVDTPEAGKLVLAPCHLLNIDDNYIYLTSEQGEVKYRIGDLK